MPSTASVSPQDVIVCECGTQEYTANSAIDADLRARSRVDQQVLGQHFSELTAKYMDRPMGVPVSVG